MGDFRLKDERQLRVGGFSTFLFLLAALLLSHSVTAAMSVSTPRVVGNNSSVPHYGYGGAVTVLKAIVSGGTGPYTVEWDYTGTGTFVSPSEGTINTGNGDITVFHTYADPANSVTYSSIVRITDSASQAATATYKIRVFPSASATNAIKADIAVDDGLWYVHRNLLRSNVNGAPTARTNDGGGADYLYGGTAVAIQAYQNKTHWAGGDAADPYTADVQAMHNYILANLTTYDVSSDSTVEDRDPDLTNRNGLGLRPSVGGDFYTSGMALASLGTADVPNQVVDARLPAAVAGKTYKWVCQEMVDYLAYSQHTVNGGWRYNPRTASPDGSQHTWVGSALYFSELKMGLYIRPELKTRFNTAVNSLLVGGGTDYSVGGAWVNTAKSAGNLGSMAFCAGDTAGAVVSDARGPEQGGAGESARITAARLFVGNNWASGGEGSSGNVGDFYAMYSLMKGSRSFVPPIQYFKSSGGTEYFWYDLYRTFILGNRDSTAAATNGKITASSGYVTGSHFQTAVGVEILELAFMISPPVAVAIADSQDVPPNGTVTLHHNESYHLDPTLSIVKYEWDFGTWQGTYYDGVPLGNYSYSTTDPNAIVTFTAGPVGTYNPVLRVTDDKSPTPQTATDNSLVITVSNVNHAPVSVPVPPGSGCTLADYIFDIGDNTLTLDGSHSYDPDTDTHNDTITAYRWTLPTGQVYGETRVVSPKPAAWTAGNTYTVILDVQDDGTWDPVSAHQHLWGTASAQVYVVTDSKPVPTTTTLNMDEDTAATLALDGTYLRAPKPLTATITALPTAGALFQADGVTPISGPGTLVTDAARRVVYVPPAGASGSPFGTFAYTLNDTVKTSAAQTVTVNVRSISITATQGTPQSATVNTAFGTLLKATVVDSLANPVPGITVTFAAPGAGAGGTFAGGVNTAVTNASGVATAAVFTANHFAGSYTVNATAPGVGPAAFSLTNNHGAPATITATAGTPQSAVLNSAFATNLQATVVDAYGNPVPGATVTFTAPATGASGTFAGGVNTAATNASGVATAAVFTANGAAGPYVVTATSGAATSASFSLMNGHLLTITADNKTKAYGAPLPAFTASCSGFVNGDTPASLTTQPTMATTATTSSFVGTYPITAGGAVAPNYYVVAYAAGTLTVLPSAAINGAPAYGPEGTTINLTSSVGDPDAGSLTYAWSVTKNGAPYATGNASTFSYTPDDNGSYTVTLTATDNNEYAANDTKTANVTNVAPTATITVPVGAKPEGTPITVTGTAADPGTVDTFAYVWRVTKNGKDYASATDGPGLGASDSFTFSPDDNGTYVVSLTVTDNAGGMGVASSKTINVTNVPPAATIVGAPESSPEGTTISLASTLSDPGTLDTFTYAWAVTKGGAPYGTGNSASFSFTPDDNATYAVSLQVADKDGGVRNAEPVSIAVTNVPPTAAIIGAPESSPEGTIIFLTSAVSDPGTTDTFTYAWQVTKDGDPYDSGSTADFSYTPDGPGIFVVKLTVTDNDGGSGVAPSRTTNVVNVPPEVTIGGAPANSLEGTAIDLSCTVIDPGIGETFAYAWSVTKEGTAYASGAASDFTFTPDDNAKYVATLTVADGKGGSGRDSKTINVLNVAPAATITVPAGAKPEGAAITVTGTATDPGTVDTFGYAWRVTKDGMDFASATHGPGLGASDTFTFTPDESASYVAALTITDKDGGSGVAPPQTIMVAAVAPEVAIVGAPESSPEGTPIALTSTVIPAGQGDTLAYAWTATKNGAPFAVGADTSFTFTPNDPGAYAVTLNVTNSGAVGTDTKNVTATNVAPSVAITGAPAAGTQGSLIVLGSVVTDPGISDTFTYAWAVSRNDAAYASGNTTSLSFTPNAPGSYVVILNVTDGDGAVGTASQTIPVGNASPTVKILNAPLTDHEGATITLNSQVTDPGTTDTFTYLWSVAKNGVALNTIGASPDFSFTLFDHGNYVITLTVTDNHGGTCSDSVELYASNVPPTVSIQGAPQTIAAGNTISLTSTVTDPGTDDTFTYQWYVKKDGNPFAGGNAPGLSFVPVDDAVYEVTLVVTDDAGGTGLAAAKIISQAPPVIESGPTADNNPAKPLQLVNFYCEASDADAISWSWDFGDGTVDHSNSYSVSHAFSPVGTYTVTVTATDANGLSSSKSLAMVIDVGGGRPLPPGTEPDSNGNGVPDVLEQIMGFDPMSPSTSPAIGPVQGMTIKGMIIKLDFATQSIDHILIRGMIPIPAGFVPTGKGCALDVGGCTELFTLTSNWGAQEGLKRVRLAIVRQKGAAVQQVARMQIVLRGNYAAILNACGLTKSPAFTNVTVPVTIILDGRMSTARYPLIYTNKLGTKGMAR